MSEELLVSLHKLPLVGVRDCPYRHVVPGCVEDGTLMLCKITPPPPLPSSSPASFEINSRTSLSVVVISPENVHVGKVVMYNVVVCSLKLLHEFDTV